MRIPCGCYGLHGPGPQCTIAFWAVLGTPITLANGTAAVTTAHETDSAEQVLTRYACAPLWERLLYATRPKFFPASVLPVLAGSAWGFSITGRLDWLPFALALAATVCLHAAANVLNDIGDDSGGTDRVNNERIYPYTGGSRFIQRGILSADDMRQWGLALLALAAALGVALLLLEGLPVLWFGLLGAALAVLYSLGPLRLNASGLGELAVGLAFGVLPVTGAAWLQSGSIDLPLLVFSLPVACWVTAILLINEVPDRRADGANGKRTLPVRMGLGATATLYGFLHISAAGLALLLSARGVLPPLAPAVPLLALLPVWGAVNTIRKAADDRARMTRAIETTLGIHAAGTLWLAACVIYTGIAG